MVTITGLKNGNFDFLEVDSLELGSTDLQELLDNKEDIGGNSSIPLATETQRGGIKIGYTQNEKNYPIDLSNEKLYVNVPWLFPSENNKINASSIADGSVGNQKFKKLNDYDNSQTIEQRFTTLENAGYITASSSETLTNKSISYNQISNPPSIPDVTNFITADSTETLTNKSISYNQISNPPSIPDVTNFITADSTETLTNKSITYNQISNPPSIPDVTNFITANSSDTLVNKSIDCDSTNVVSNISNNNIKDGAGIQASKIADGSVGNNKFRKLADYTSSSTIEQRFTAIEGAGYITASSSETLTNKSISYNQLTNTPTIPTNNNQLTNGSNFINTNDSVALKNKLIDADEGNTILNITNSAISNSANINANKLGDGTISNSEFQTLQGITTSKTIQTQLDDKINNTTSIIKNRVFMSNFSLIQNPSNVLLSSDMNEQSPIYSWNGTLPTNSYLTYDGSYKFTASANIDLSISCRIHSTNGQANNRSYVHGFVAVGNSSNSDIIQYPLSSASYYKDDASSTDDLLIGGTIRIYMETGDYFQVMSRRLYSQNANGNIFADVTESFLIVEAFDYTFS